jgi:hypothetical protein
MNPILDNIIEKINQITSTKIDGKEFALMNKESYKAYNISNENFHAIESTESDKQIAFVDGGNIEVFASSNFSLQLVRTYYTVYQNNKKVKSKLFEFFVLVYSVVKDDEIYYEFELFPVKNNLDLGKISFDSSDESICVGNNRATPSKIVEVIRRLLELKTVESLIEILDQGDIVIIDGSLEAKTAHESLILEGIYNLSKSSEITISGLAKTSRWFTNKGNNLLPLLSYISPKNIWYYHPVVDIKDNNYNAEVYFIKLHNRSDYIFRFEVHNGINHDIKLILGLLARNSIDPSFLGYPYGLIDADRFARVSYKEKQIIEARLLAKSSKSFKELRKHFNSVNAHNILDSV